MKYTPIVMPTFEKINGVTKVAVAIDTSGSTDNDMFDVIRATMRQLVASLSEAGPFKLTFWAFDNFVHYKSIEELTEHNKDLLDEKLDSTLSYGRGGSSYSESFHLVYALHLMPCAFVFITDGLVSSNGKLMYNADMKNYVFLLRDKEASHEVSVPFQHTLHVLNYSRKNSE